MRLKRAAVNALTPIGSAGFRKTGDASGFAGRRCGDAADVISGRTPCGERRALDVYFGCGKPRAYGRVPRSAARLFAVTKCFKQQASVIPAPAVFCSVMRPVD